MLCKVACQVGLDIQSKLHELFSMTFLFYLYAVLYCVIYSFCLESNVCFLEGSILTNIDHVLII